MNGICVEWCNFNETSKIRKNGIPKNLAVRPVKISSCLKVNFFFWYKPRIVMINFINFGPKEKSMMLMSKRTSIYVTFYDKICISGLKNLKNWKNLNEKWASCWEWAKTAKIGKNGICVKWGILTSQTWPILFWFYCSHFNWSVQNHTIYSR